MKSKNIMPKTRNNNKFNLPSQKSTKTKLNNSQTINFSPKNKEAINIKLNNNTRLKNNSQIKYNQTTLINNNNKIKTEKKLKERTISARPVQIKVRNSNFNQDLYEKILAFKKAEKNKNKNKIRTNSALDKKNPKLSNKEINKLKIVKNIYINEKDLSELDKNNQNSLYSFISVLHVNWQIEIEIIDIIKNSNNIKDKKDLYKKLFELFNNIFEGFNFFSKNEINFFIIHELNKLAQDYAERLSQKKAPKIPIYKGIFLGENRYIYKGKMFDVEDMCNEWYNEIKLYDQNTNEYEKNTSHFTQMIWKNTKDVGFGFIRKREYCYAVAFYYPPGNTLGEYKENVLF
jgi:hypothetical protein